MPSNLSADKPKTRVRERFASPLVIALVVGTGLSMLVTLYPEKEILLMLGEGKEHSPAVKQYLEALIRIRPNDLLLRMKLARIYINTDYPEKALGVTNGIDLRRLSKEDARELDNIRYQASLQRLLFASKEKSQWPLAQSEYAAIIESRIKSGAGKTEIAAMLADAAMAGDKFSVRRLESIIPPSVSWGMKSGDQEADEEAGKLLVKGNYPAAAEAYISYIPKRGTLQQKRRLFFAAIASLQSGNKPVDALALAERNIETFKDDRETLVFVTRVALAANRPQVAQKYVKRALRIRTVEAAG